MKTKAVILKPTHAIALFLLLPLLLSCSEESTPPVIKDTAEITIVSGSEQKGTSGEWLAQPVKILVRDKNRAPIPGVKVYFNIIEGNGETDNSWVICDDMGRAEVRWKIGNAVMQTAQLSLDEAAFDFEPVTVQAYNERWAFISIVSGNSQTAGQGEALTRPLVLKVADINGTPLPNIHIDFTITAGGGTLNTYSAVTGEQGRVKLMPTMGSGLFQRIRACIDDEYYFARYAFVQSNIVSSYDMPAGYKWTTYTNTIPWGSGNQISHDGKILETDNFLIFSDACSDEIKIQYAVMAEDSWSELIQLFNVNPATDLGIYTNDPASKMKLYCSRSAEVQMCAFAYGFILYDINHTVWHTSPWAPSRHLSYRNIVKHETMHVLQFYLIENGAWPPFWFSEGLSEYVSGGSFYHIERLSTVNYWYSQPNHINPVGIVNQEQEIPNANPDLIGQYYPMFGLAVEYLLDPRGLGKTIEDLKNIFEDVKQGISFETSFHSRMGITVEYYKNNFRDLINQYFTKYEANN